MLTSWPGCPKRKGTDSLSLEYVTNSDVQPGLAGADN